MRTSIDPILSSTHSITSSKPSHKSTHNNILTTAIKAYKDEFFTGLTDEEREQIKKDLKAYLDKYPIKNEADRKRYNDYFKSLLKKYGYKGNPEELLASLTDELKNESNNDGLSTDTLTDSEFAFKKMRHVMF